MKKLILIAAIAIALLSSTAQAQTIVSGKVAVKLSSDDISYVMRKGTPSMIEALKTNATIKNSDIGDNILALLNNRKGFSFIAKN